MVVISSALRKSARPGRHRPGAAHREVRIRGEERRTWLAELADLECRACVSARPPFGDVRPIVARVGPDYRLPVSPRDHQGNVVTVSLPGSGCRSDECARSAWLSTTELVV